MISPSLSLVSRYNRLPNEMRCLIAQYFDSDDICDLVMARHKIDLSGLGICLSGKDFRTYLLGCFDGTPYRWDPVRQDDLTNHFGMLWFIEKEFPEYLDIEGCYVPEVPCKRLKFSQ